MFGLADTPAICRAAADTILSSANADYLARPRRVTGIRRIADGKPFFAEEYPDLIAEEARRLWSEGVKHTTWARWSS